ncbi:MAG: ribonuclease H-like domain-containing protein [Anaerolineae bacterium]
MTEPALPRVLTLDLETQRGLDEIQGREDLHRLGLAVAVIHDAATDEITDYQEHQADLLLKTLWQADLVVGYNLKGFDYPVLEGYSDRPLSSLPTLDLMEEIAARTGFRVGLDNVASATLGAEKSADGLQAIRWFRDGQLDRVIEYCRRDVEITRAVYDHGWENGHVLYWDRRRGARVPVPVAWRRPR